MTTNSHRTRMLHHLVHQQLMDQLIRSVELCERDRHERVETVTRSNKCIKVKPQNSDND
jgi:hypothetical protein